MLKRANMVVVLLVMNLILLLVIAYLVIQARSNPSAIAASTATAIQTNLRTTVLPPSLKVVKTNVNLAPTFRWNELETADYRIYIARLRSIGCPEQTIRDLVIADIDKHFAAKIHAINPAARELPYWQTDNKENESAAEFQERQKQLREIDFTKRQVLKELLGVDLISERNKVQGVEDPLGRRLGFLSDDKRSQVRMILEHFNAEDLNIRQKLWMDGEQLSEEDKEQLATIQQERDKAILSMLSPEEKKQYDLTMSPLAYKIRDSLACIKPSENEYLALYELQKKFQEKWPEGDQPPSDPSKYAEWEKEQIEMQNQIKDSLGEQRYAEYVKTQDPDYRGLSIVGSKFKIASESIQEVYGYKQIVETYRTKLLTDPNLTPEARLKALNDITTETERSVKSILGEKGYNYYLRNGYGNWIRGQ